jgi:predicted transcriptional regulator
MDENEKVKIMMECPRMDKKQEKIAKYILETLDKEITQLYDKIDLLEKENDDLQNQVDALLEKNYR